MHSQAGQFVGRKAPVAQNLRIAIGLRWCRLAGWRATKARRWCRLDDAIHFDEGIPRQVVCMQGGFVHIKHRCDAGIAALENGTPRIARPGGEDGRQLFLECRPLAAIPLGFEGWIINAGFFQKQRIKLRFDGAYRQPLAVAALVGVVEMGAAIEQVIAAKFSDELKSRRNCDANVISIKLSACIEPERRVFRLILLMPDAPLPSAVVPIC